MDPARLPHPGLFLPPPLLCTQQGTANRVHELQKHIAAPEAYADAERFHVKLARASALAQPSCEAPSPRPCAVHGSDVPGLPTRPVEVLTKSVRPHASCGIRSGLNHDTGSLEIHWSARARKLTSSDRVFTSPGFEILGTPFKMIVCAKAYRWWPDGYFQECRRLRPCASEVRGRVVK